jgi:S-adenosylmethionine:tRNA ribosyltransferase-isomerase
VESPVIAATRPRDDPRTTRLLHVDPRRGTFRDGAIGDLRTALRAGDLLVVNDAATLPASLAGFAPSGAPVEARLVGGRRDGAWPAVLFGAGDWHARTEDRPPPPRLAVGDALQFAGVRASVAAVDPRSPRLVSLAFDAEGDALWRALYRAGRPVQYSYLDRPLALWDVQTAYAARPWAAEAPSTGFALTWDLLIDLRRRGVGVASVTHAAGLSSTGDSALDALLPFAEAYEVTQETAFAVARARSGGGRVVAAGTTVVRALEGAAADGGGRLAARAGTTSLVVGEGTPLRVADGIVTGVHEEATSHFRLLEAFAPRDLLLRAHAFAEARGFVNHEFGDAVLVLPGAGDRAA